MKKTKTKVSKIAGTSDFFTNVDTLERFQKLGMTPEQQISAYFSTSESDVKEFDPEAFMAQSDQYESDPQWKKSIRKHLKGILDFCLPRLSATIDWEFQPIPRDKEFEKRGSGMLNSKRIADFLFQVKCKSGEMKWLFLHFEIQSSKQDCFEQRMFEYHYKIYDIFKQHPIGIAFLIDRHLDWQPNCYQDKNEWTELCFNYTVIKLLELEKRLEESKDSHEPIVILMRAQLAVLKSYQGNRKNMNSLLKYKKALATELLNSSLSQNVVNELMYMVDWMMKLKGEHMTQYNKFIEQKQKSTRFISTLEQIGIAQGRKDREAEAQAAIQAATKEAEEKAQAAIQAAQAAAKEAEEKAQARAKAAAKEAEEKAQARAKAAIKEAEKKAQARAKAVAEKEALQRECLLLTQMLEQRFQQLTPEQHQILQDYTTEQMTVAFSRAFSGAPLEDVLAAASHNR